MYPVAIIRGLGWYDGAVWRNIFAGLMVFLSGSVKIGEASPTGSVKKIIEIRPVYYSNEFWSPNKTLLRILPKHFEYSIIQFH